MMMPMKTIYNQNILVDFKGRIAQKKRIEQYTKDTLRYFIPRLRRVVSVNIIVSNTLEDDCYGWCLGDRKEIEIELARSSGKNSFDLDYMMLNLAHELIHAKQFLTGQLSPCHFRWKTKDYKNTAYSRTPWEREAYKKEDYIYETFWLGKG
jgi:hypothetical protein